MIILVSKEYLEEFMKIFKHIPKDNYDYLNLQDDIKKTGDELQIVYNNLQNVVEPDLIDY